MDRIETIATEIIINRNLCYYFYFVKKKCNRYEWNIYCLQSFIYFVVNLFIYYVILILIKWLKDFLNFLISLFFVLIVLPFSSFFFISLIHFFAFLILFSDNLSSLPNSINFMVLLIHLLIEFRCLNTKYIISYKNLHTTYIKQ